MSTFLELVNLARQKCGVSGSDLISVGGVTGEARRFVNNVNDAWTEIQNSQAEWRFMHVDFTLPLVAGTRTYASGAAFKPDLSAVDSFGRWDFESARIYADTVNFSDEMILPFIDYRHFRNIYEFATMRTQRQRPVVYSVDDANAIRVGPLPDGAYTMAGRYWRGPQTLVANTDVPIMPARFHMLIVYSVMKKYGMFEAASEVVEDGNREYGRMYNDLLTDQGPEITFGAPLA